MGGGAIIVSGELLQLDGLSAELSSSGKVTLDALLSVSRDPRAPAKHGRRVP